MEEKKIYVIHENDEWVVPLREGFAHWGLPHEEWFIDERAIDLAAAPPPGVFYNRMSASSHTRGHRYAPETTRILLDWLVRHGRKVVNGPRALDLEINKVGQYLALARAGIDTPRTVAVSGVDALRGAARDFGEWPLIVKPNRGGKGLGVQRVDSAQALDRLLDAGLAENAIDGIVLLQQYVRATEPYITRAEFIGGRFYYAVRVSTDQGFELCPADVCEVGDAFCPAPGAEAQVPLPVAAPAPAAPRFDILAERLPAAQIDAYERFLAANDIGVAGIEFIADEAGRVYTYDVNTNTNYNGAAESRTEYRAMRRLARHLGDLLEG